MDKPTLILGATSGIGRLTMEQALARGGNVRAFARSADKLETSENLEPFKGDALNASDVSRALEGVRSVIYTLGVRERLAMLWEKETLFSRTTGLLLKEMQTAGIKRLIVVTGFGAGRSRASMSSLERLGHNAVLGRVYGDKTVQEQLVMGSALDWTIVRPVILNNRPASGRPRALVNPTEWRNGIISRADVAAYLIRTEEENLHIRQDIVLTR